jgi:hypothetical protein
MFMSIKFEINNSENYEYLIHGQDLQIKFHMPYCLFTMVIYKETHTKLWFHKFLTGTYYIAPIIYFYNFLILKSFPGLKNKSILDTTFDYPGTAYKYNRKRNSIWDFQIKIKKNKSTLHTTANYQHPGFLFIGFGLGIKVKRLKLNTNNVEVLEDRIESPKAIIVPNLVNITNQTLLTISPIYINSNVTKINKIKTNSKFKQPICSINTKELFKYN